MPRDDKCFLPLIDSFLSFSSASRRLVGSQAIRRGGHLTISPTTAAASCDATLMPNGASQLTATRTAFRANAENAIGALACMRGSQGEMDSTEESGQHERGGRRVGRETKGSPQSRLWLHWRLQHRKSSPTPRGASRFCIACLLMRATGECGVSMVLSRGRTRWR